MPDYPYFARVKDEWIVLENLLTKAANKQLWNSVFLSAIIWLVVVLLYFALNRHDPWGPVVFFAFVTLAVLLAVTSVWYSNSSKNEILRFLKQSGEEVVWVYYHKMEHLPFGLKMSATCTLIFADKEGQLHRILLPEKGILEIMNALRNYLPFAVFGFSRYKEQLYRSSPSLLSKEKHDEEYEA